MNRALAVALVLCAGGCARWRVVAQSPVNPPAVQQAPAIAMAPLGFSLPPVVGESPESWNNHLRGWSDAFREEVAARAERLGQRALLWPPPGAPIPDGVFVTTVVRAIDKGDFGGYDAITADLTVIDARTRMTLLTATIETKNKRGGWENYTFGGRVKLATLNLADAVIEALRLGYLP